MMTYRDAEHNMGLEAANRIPEPPQPNPIHLAALPHLIELFKKVADICDDPDDGRHNWKSLMRVYNEIFKTEEVKVLYDHLIETNPFNALIGGEQ